eukprot:EG_transcript_33431
MRFVTQSPFLQHGAAITPECRNTERYAPGTSPKHVKQCKFGAIAMRIALSLTTDGAATVTAACTSSVLPASTVRGRANVTGCWKETTVPGATTTGTAYVVG